MNIKNWDENIINAWPKAVEDELLCDPESENDITNRAKTIIEYFIADSLENKKFLDFGCGTGHVVSEASKNAALAVGYDIVSSKTWNDNCTTSIEKIKDQGPYDAILIYDVLDHSKDPVECLQTVKSLCHKNSKIYLLLNPWCSRHAGHLYQKINLAFAHLILNEEELESVNCKLEESIKIVRPIINYKKWISDVGFKIEKHEIIRDKVEVFFKSNKFVRTRLMQSIQSVDPSLVDFPEFQLEQSFHEFVLVPE